MQKNDNKAKQKWGMMRDQQYSFSHFYSMHKIEIEIDREREGANEFKESKAEERQRQSENVS